GALWIAVEHPHDIEELGTGLDTIRDLSLFRIDRVEFIEGPFIGLLQIDLRTEELSGEQGAVFPPAGLVFRRVLGQFGTEGSSESAGCLSSAFGPGSQFAPERTGARSGGVCGEGGEPVVRLAEGFGLRCASFNLQAGGDSAELVSRVTQ